MLVVIKKWGNSASVRIPVALMQAAELRLNQTVDMREEHGRIVLVPLREEAFDLAALVAGIRPGNLHDLIDFGPQVGNEVW